MTHFLEILEKTALIYGKIQATFHIQNVKSYNVGMLTTLSNWIGDVALLIVSA